MDKQIHRESGVFILEFIVALGVMSVGMLGFFAMFQASLTANELGTQADYARLALDNTAELLRRDDFRSLYDNFHGARIEAPNLTAPDGQPAQVEIQCFVNELAIPPEFGPVPDIDGSGGLETLDCSTTYRLMPVRLSLTTAGPNNTEQTYELFLLLERGS